jgi:hypothetical protein
LAEFVETYCGGTSRRLDDQMLCEAMLRN